MRLLFRCLALRAKPHLRLIALIGVMVPRRLRGDWRQEWEAELQHRERLLADWDRLDAASRLDLVRRSTAAFWDALWLQRHRWEDDMVQDLRFGLRMLVKHPAVSLIAIATLALGIGANTAIFSVVNALLLRPLAGVEAPERLVLVGRQYADKTYLSDSSYPDYLDYRARITTMSGLALTAPTAFHLSTGQEADRVEGELVSGNYFDVLGVRAAQGRLIRPADEQAGAPPVAVISTRLWQRRFAGQAGVIGRTVRLDGHSFTIVGVATAAFEGTKVGTPRDVWAPILTLRDTDSTMTARFGNRATSWLELFGRLNPGVTIDGARAEFQALAQQLERDHPATNRGAGGGVEPGLGRDTEVRRQAGRFASVPLVAVAIVLVIACANVAGLLLTRAAARQKEIGVRLALGARRLRIVRQLLTESLTLALLGGGAGLLVGVGLTRWLQTLLPERYLFLSFDLDFGLDWRVFTFTLAISLVTGVIFGLIPALQATRPDLIGTLKDGRRRGSATGGRVRGTLVVIQVALSLVLLIAAGLCVRTLENASAIDTGYDVARVLTARIDLGKQGYDQARGRLFQQQLIERVQAVPGVQAAGLAVTLPLNDGRWETGIFREGDTRRVQTFQNFVSARYLEALNIPVLAGRPFSDRDDARAPRVAIVNQTLARRLWPGVIPLGQRLTLGFTAEVIGVAQDIKGRNLFESPGPMLYLPLSQHYQAATVVHVRTSVPPPQLVAAFRREVTALDADLPVYSIRPLDDHLTATLTPQRLLASLVTAFGLLALLLAATGLYGLLSSTVTDRTREIGIRTALGAPRGAVRRLVVAQGMRLALGGVALGLIAAFGLTRLMAGLLFGVSAVDPVTFTGIALLLLLVALVACDIPARRASHLDPKTALRSE